MIEDSSGSHMQQPRMRVSALRGFLVRDCLPRILTNAFLIATSRTVVAFVHVVLFRALRSDLVNSKAIFLTHAFRCCAKKVLKLKALLNLT